MSQCDCTSVVLNTGSPAKQQVLNAASKLIFVRMRDDAGKQNGISLEQDTTQEWLNALLINSDESKRWFPIGPLTAVENVRAEPTYETFEDNSRAITSKGLKTFTGMLIGFAPAYMKVLNSVAGCSEIGFYTIDRCGRLSGSVSSDGMTLYPIRIARSSFDTQYVQGTASASAKIQVRFDVDMIENDGNIRTLTSAEADFLNAEGLVQVMPTLVGTPTSTSFKTALRLMSGSFEGGSFERGAGGWGKADFVLKRADNSTIDITDDFNEDSTKPGLYTFTFAEQTAGAELTLSKATGKQPKFDLPELKIKMPASSSSTKRRGA